jgi:hypothetical protein
MKSLPSPDCTVSFGEDQILVSSQDYQLLSIVPPLSSREPPGPLVQSTSTDLLASADDRPYLKFSQADLKAFVGSTKGVVTDDSPVQFLATERGVELSSTTLSSKVNFNIKAETNLEEPFSLELKFLKNILSKSGENIHLSVSDGVLVMKSGSVGMITTTFSA